MNEARQETAWQIAKRLYCAMPGTISPPVDPERGILWGEIEATPQWGFCEQIACEILRATSGQGEQE